MAGQIYYVDTSKPRGKQISTRPRRGYRPKKRATITTRKTKSRGRGRGHRAIRRSCKTCAHKPAQLRRNPSLHNHHMKGAYCRYHFRQPLGRKYCTMDGKPRKKLRK
jgi:hypothetical protein